MKTTFGQLTEGDEFTPDNGKTWMTVEASFNVYDGSGKAILLVVTVSGKRWWGRHNEEVIVRP